MDFIDAKGLYTILHIFGAALGAGGAYMSDAMFMSSVKDDKLSATEMRFLRIGSAFVWLGLTLLLLSGVGIFFTDPTFYMDSSKFLAKMSIVLIIALNGLVFHISHLPRMHRHIGAHLPSSDEFTRKKALLVVSGAVSFSSWTSALILGSLRGLPFSYIEIMSIYLGFVAIATLGAFVVFRYKK